MRKMALCFLSLSLFLVSCMKGDSSSISSIDVNIESLELDFHLEEMEKATYFQVVDNELYYSISVPNENRSLNYHSHTKSLNKLNLETNEMTTLKKFEENLNEYVTSFLIKDKFMYYNTIKVSDDYSELNPFEFTVYVESEENQQRLDSGYLYDASLVPRIYEVNNEVFYTTLDLKIEDTLLGTGQYGFKLMNLSKDTVNEVFSSYAPMQEFIFDNNLFERLIRFIDLHSGKYLTFKTSQANNTYNYVYDTEDRTMERLKIGHNVSCIGMLGNQLLLVNYKDYNKFASDIMRYEILDIETKERSDCGESLYLWATPLSKDVMIGYKEMQPFYAIYIDENGQMQQVPIEDEKMKIKGGGQVLPITDTSFIISQGYGDDYIITLDIEY